MLTRTQLALSTFTSAPRALPHAIHFSHQFAYYTLDKDCHALIRRYQFAIGRAKIDVRREVEASAFAFGPGVDASASGEAFVEGYGVSSSFDEPLASALAGTHYCDARPPLCCRCSPTARLHPSAARCPCAQPLGLGTTSRKVWEDQDISSYRRARMRLRIAPVETTSMCCLPPHRAKGQSLSRPFLRLRGVRTC
jgi:hypothetical protein